ncbi:MAG: hypothetical protein JSS20_05095 [Proteobacteria bacterium]|nr:hypothetical protein [Pseudomonadota bacterium]
MAKGKAANAVAPATAPANARRRGVRARGAPPKEIAARADDEALVLKDALAKVSGRARRRSGDAAAPPVRVLSAKERSSLKGVVIYLDEEARKQLHRLAIDQGRTTQDLGVEAVNLLFELYGIAAIA